MIAGPFTYKGIHSSQYNIIVKSGNRSIIPAMPAKLITIPGMHGVHDFGKNTYANRNIPTHLAYIGEDYLALRTKAREIAAWLTSSKYEPLTFDDEPNVYYLARIYDEVALRTLFRLGEADIVFNCLPFALSQERTGADLTWGSNIIWGSDYIWDNAAPYRIEVLDNTTFDIEYTGTQDLGYGSPAGSQFDVIITGSFSALSITLNNKTINYDEAVSNSTVTINNIKATVKKGDENKLSACSGDLDEFLKLIPGTNTVMVTGAGLNCSVLFDFRPQFI